MATIPKPTSFFNSMIGKEESDTKKKNKKYKIPDPATAESAKASTEIGNDAAEKASEGRESESTNRSFEDMFPGQSSSPDPRVVVVAVPELPPAPAKAPSRPSSAAKKTRKPSSCPTKKLQVPAAAAPGVGAAVKAKGLAAKAKKAVKEKSSKKREAFCVTIMML